VTADAFAAALEHWHDFYLLAGTAAATLLGLLFVALSMHLELVVREDAVHLRVLAREAFYSFMFVLLLSLILLIPDTHPRPMGVELAGMGAMRLVLLVIGQRTSAASVGHGFNRRQVRRRILPAIVAAGMLIASGVMISRRTDVDDGLMFIVMTCAVLLATATASAWDLIMRVGEAKHRARPS
jgi:hypothetical protein